MILPLTSRGQSLHIPLWAPRSALFFAYRRRGSSRKMPVARHAASQLWRRSARTACVPECAEPASVANIIFLAGERRPGSRAIPHDSERLVQGRWPEPLGRGCCASLGTAMVTRVPVQGSKMVRVMADLP